MHVLQNQELEELEQKEDIILNHQVNCSEAIQVKMKGERMLPVSIS